MAQLLTLSHASAGDKLCACWFTCACFSVKQRVACSVVAVMFIRGCGVQPLPAALCTSAVLMQHLPC